MANPEDTIAQWREARAAAAVQLEAFESGRTTFHQNGVDVSDRHIQALRTIVANYDLLIESWEGPDA